jgi:hypothetical protein
MQIRQPNLQSPRRDEQWFDGLNRAYDLRNDIIHAGPSESNNSAYVEALATRVLPFLNEYLGQAFGVPLENVVTAAVLREIDVARRVALRIIDDGGSPSASIFKTLARRISHNREPEFEDDSERTVSVRALELLEWADEPTAAVTCRICGFYSAHATVTFDRRKRIVAPVALNCLACGLKILHGDVHLAAYHLSPLEDHEVEAFFDRLDNEGNP